MTLHVLQCPAAKQIFHEKSTDLVQSLQQYPTKLELLHGIKVLLNMFLASSNDDPLHLMKFSSIATNEISVQHQLQLPLHEFMRGRIVKTWCKEQDQFLTRIRSRWFANRWAQSLIHGIWQLYFSLWLHPNDAYHSDLATQSKIQQLLKLNQEI